MGCLFLGRFDPTTNSGVSSGVSGPFRIREVQFLSTSFSFVFMSTGGGLEDGATKKTR